MENSLLLAPYDDNILGIDLLRVFVKKRVEHLKFNYTVALHSVSRFLALIYMYVYTYVCM